MRCSTTQLRQRDIPSPSSEKCCQGVLYIGMPRKHCLVLFAFLLFFLLYLTSMLGSFHPSSSPPPIISPRFSRQRDLISGEDLRPVPPRRLIPTLKNPCWFEDESKYLDPYDGNPYIHFSGRARRSFERLLRRRIRGEKPPSNPDEDDSPTYPRRLRCVPYFYIAGMPKCGTTDLYDRLTRQPEVLTGVIKEPHWWTRKRFGAFHPQTYNSSTSSTTTKHASFDDYVDLFDEAAVEIAGSVDEDAEMRSRKIIVDASASLLWDNDGWLNFLNWKLRSENKIESSSGKDPFPPLIVSHLKNLHPKSKLIVMLRDPVKRLYSDYLYFRLKGDKTVDNFHDRVVKSVDAFRACTRMHNLRSCVYAPEVHNVGRVVSSLSTKRASTSVRLRIGMYSVFLRDWFDQFPRDQILVLRLEDYAAKTKEALRNIFQFLGISSDGRSEEERREEIRNKHYLDIGPMKNETETLLREFYADYNADLAALLNDKNFLWKD